MNRRLLCLVAAALCAASIPAEAEDPARPLLRLDAGGHTAAVRSVLFRPGGRELVSVAFDKSIRLWNVQGGDALHSLFPPAGPGKIGALYAAALSPDGRILAVAGLFPEHQVYLIDLESRQIQKTLKGHASTVQSVAWLDARRIVTGSHDNTARIWNVETGQLLMTLEGHTAPIYCVASAPGGTRCVTASLDKTAILWNTMLGKPVATLRGHSKEILTAAWSADGKTVATGGLDGTVRLWDQNGVAGKTFDQLGGAEILSIAISPGSTKLVYAQGNGTGRHCGVIDLPSSQVTTKFPHHTDSVLHASFSADGRTVATGDGAGVIYVWSANEGDVQRRFSGSGQVPTSVGWDKEGVAVGWGTESDTGKPEAERPLERSFDLSRLEFIEPPNTSYSRARLVQGSTGLIRTGDTTVDVVRGDEKVSTLEMSNDNEKQYNRVRAFTLLPGDRAGLAAEFGLYLYDTRNGQRIRTYSGHTGPVWAVSPSPDGRYLLTASGDRTLRVWDLEHDESLLTFFVAGDEWIAFTPEGYYAASAGGERLMGWQVDQGPDRLAAFHPAERFHRALYKPEVIQMLLRTGSTERAVEVERVVKTDINQVLPPAVVIASPDRPRITVGTEEVTIKAIARQVGPNPIRSLQVLLDGRTLGGRAGKFDYDKPTAEIRQDFRVKLSPGRVHQVTVQAESDVSKGLSTPVEVTFKPAVAADTLPTLYVIAMGVSEYTDESLKLNFAAEDAKAVDASFRKQSAGVYKNVVTKVVVDKECTRAGILGGLTWLKKQMTQHDVGVVFFSGHGDRDETGGFYLLPSDVDRGSLVISAVADSQIKGLLAGIPGRLLILLDACHSGSIGGDTRKHAKSLTDDLVRDLSNTDYGVVVMASSMGREYSLESAVHQRGFFTVALTEGLAGLEYSDSNRDGLIYLAELDAYVSQRVKDLTQGVQHPVTAKPTTIQSFPLSKK